MTLKEKLSQTRPKCVNPEFGGGVIGCPHNYPELQHIGNCQGDGFNVWLCAACWNQEYKEPGHEAG